MKKTKLPRQTRTVRARKTRRKPASKHLDPQPNARGVFRDGSKLLTDSRGLIVGLVEARPKYTFKRQTRRKA
jgi:hypothetical protein